MAAADDTTGMLRTIINNQSNFRQEMVGKLDRLDKKLTGKIDQVEKNLSERIDNVDNRLNKMGKQLAYLEDDAPTREEHTKLEKRVSKLERKVASSL